MKPFARAHVVANPDVGKVKGDGAITRHDCRVMTRIIEIEVLASRKQLAAPPAAYNLPKLRRYQPLSSYVRRLNLGSEQVEKLWVEYLQRRARH